MLFWSTFKFENMEQIYIIYKILEINKLMFWIH